MRENQLSLGVTKERVAETIGNSSAFSFPMPFLAYYFKRLEGLTVSSFFPLFNRVNFFKLSAIPAVGASAARPCDSVFLRR